jgi:4-hydroxybenzoate polyprenyltransferase
MPALMPDTLPAAVDSGTVWRAAIEACFYGHLFYGVCAVAQVIETSVQLGLPVNGWLTVVSFIGTVLFYSYPYTRRSANSADPRVAWHRRHRGLVNRLQRWAMLALIALSAWVVIRHRVAIRTMTPLEWIVLLVFPCAGGLYYGAPVISRAIALRRSGWLKPFVIGFVWAGVVVAYPILFARLQFGHNTPLSLFPCLLFVKTLMFVAVLAILFDIKDRDLDQRVGLSTVVTLVGPERTLFQVSLPLTVLGVATFLSYATMQHLTIPRVLLVLAPFGLLVAGIVSLTRPRTTLYYLTVIDGLMLAKALLDILAMRY